MPLTAKGRKILKSMRSHYGKAKGTRVFYASQRSGRIKGTHRKRTSGRTRHGHGRKRH